MRRANWFKEPVASSLGLQKAGRVGLTRKDLAVLEGEVPKGGSLGPPAQLPSGAPWAIHRRRPFRSVGSRQHAGAAGERRGERIGDHGRHGRRCASDRLRVVLDADDVCVMPMTFVPGAAIVKLAAVAPLIMFP